MRKYVLFAATFSTAAVACVVAAFLTGQFLELCTLAVCLACIGFIGYEQGRSEEFERRMRRHTESVDRQTRERRREL